MEILKSLRRSTEKRLMRLQPKPPFRVDLVDQFQGHCEYGYGTEDYYDDLDEAIEVARQITEEGIKHCGSVENWHGMGNAGLVYDSQGKLVWDGIEEYTK